MNRWILIGIVLYSSLASAQTQPKDRWAAWRPFVGTWVGVGSGQPGQGAGEFTFEPELQGAVLVRHNYAEYPATKDKPAYRHDDLMVIYADSENTRADYWDNEGHVIHYVAGVSAEKLVFVSDAAQAGPRYRLTYVKTGADTLKLTFEIAPPNDRSAFKPYITSEAKRK
ncbi:MAG TPA: hypothetical protein VGG15_01755 [Terriglobales bacterium]|jgi:hypothetical protein